MCGGTAQTTQQVAIPPEVMQNYRAVNARATEVAATPFQQYSTDPNAFVAPINQAQQTGMNAISAAGGVAQPYFQGATQQLMGGQAAATPYYGEATQQLLGGLNAGVTGTQAAYQPLQQGAQAAQGLQGGAYNQYQNALQSSQPYNQAAGQYAQAGLGAATPYYGQAAQNITGAQDVGGALGGASLSSLQQAGQAAQPLQGDAAGNINSAASAAQPLNQAAIRSIMQGNRAAQPLQQQAAAGLGAAQAGAQPYQQLATNFGLSGSQAVNAGPLGGEQINQYMSPYLDSVVGSTMANLRQQQGQEQSSLVGNQVAQGAFGGDRGRLAQANLARQQNLATGQTVSGLMNQGYGQALGAAQQQQQLGLGAAQANRAAQQQASQQMLGIGQQGFGQGMATAQQQAALGQQLYGQGIGSGQALAGIGQQQYGQQMGTGQAQAALGSQLFGQGAQTAQQQAAMGQQLYGQGMGAASAQQGLGQGLYGMGTGMGGFMQGLGQQNYAQQSGTGQNLAQLGQQTFGQGAAQSGQQAALAQQQYGMGAGAAGQMAGLGQGLYGMGAGTSQALAGMGTQAQQNALAAGQAQLGAGTVAQQTQQAGQTALYNQFLQQQGFPYQQAQFLANIAMGTGALSGSTTNTSQAAPFFSDERLKEGVEPIGKTFDGQKIVKFRYKNEPGTRIGLIAQDVEKHHPDAVGLAGGYKTVDYDAATKDAASKGHYASGGLAPESEGGAVLPFPMRRGFAEGGNPAQLIGNNELAAILQAQFGMYNNQGIPGLGGAPGMTGFVPEGTLPVGNLTVADAPPALPESQLKGMIEAAGGVKEAYAAGKQGVKKIKRQFNTDEENAANDAAEAAEAAEAARAAAAAANRANGGLVGHYASGGASSGPYGIPISKAETPDLITAGDAPEHQKSGFLKMMNMAGDLASLGQQGADTYNSATKSKAAGGAAEDDVGSGTPYDAGSNPFMPDSAKGIEKKELAKPGAAPGAPESGFSQAMGLAKDIGSIAALAMMMNRGGRTGKDIGGGIFGNPAGDFDAADERAKLLASFNRSAPPATEQPANDAPRVQSPGLAPPMQQPVRPSPPSAIQGFFGNPAGDFDAADARAKLMAYFNSKRQPPAASPQYSSVRTDAAPVLPAAPTRNVARPAVPRKTAGLIPTPTPRPNVIGEQLPEITGGMNVGLAPKITSAGEPTTVASLAAPGLGGASVQAPTDTHAAENALLARTGLSAPNIRQDLQKDADKKPSFLDKAERMLAPKGGYLDRLSQGDEDTVVSLLTGLGAMAGSSNRYGLGALAEGIGAGAAAYSPAKQAILGRKETEADIGFKKAQTLKELGATPGGDRFIVYASPTPQGYVAYDKYREMPLTREQYLAVKNELVGDVYADGQTPSSLNMGNDNTSKPASNIPGVQTPINKVPLTFKINSPPPNPADVEAKFGKAALVEAIAGPAPSGTSSQVENYNNIVNQINKLSADKKIELDNSAAGFGPTYGMNMYQLGEVSKYLADTDLNRSSPMLADVIGKMLSLPGVRNLVPDSWKRYQDATDITGKVAALQAMSQAGVTLNGAPASALATSLETVATPGISQETKRNIIKQTMANLEMQKGLHDTYVKNRNQIADVDGFINQFYQDNPMQTFINIADKRLPAFAGAPSSAQPGTTSNSNVTPVTLPDLQKPTDGMTRKFSDGKVKTFKGNHWFEVEE